MGAVSLDILIARIGAAIGPDRELDAELALAFGWQRKWEDSYAPHGWFWRNGDMSWTQSTDYPPAYTDDIRVLIALVPADATMMLHTKPVGPAVAIVGDTQARAATLPLALALVLLLRRREAQFDGLLGRKHGT